MSGDGAAAPAVASARGYLRAGLPSIYQEGDFGMRFVSALETLLDPIVATLDNLPAHFDSRLTDPGILELLAAWLGVELDESWPQERRRELVRMSSELSRRRGTRAGLEQALRIAFPDLPLRVEDDGGVVHAGSPADLPAAPPPRFVVYCDVPLEEPAGLARMIEIMKPVHVQYRLRIRSAKRGPEGA
ncbi:MAG: phage tail protein [Thermoleophilia bacterium]